MKRCWTLDLHQDVGFTTRGVGRCLSEDVRGPVMRRWAVSEELCSGDAWSSKNQLFSVQTKDIGMT